VQVHLYGYNFESADVGPLNSSKRSYSVVIINMNGSSLRSEAVDWNLTPCAEPTVV
jgi:hypothetical protein